MKTEKGLYKTAEQIEFAELFKKLNWKNSDVAYALHVSRSAITMILKGARNPRAATLAAMRELLEKQGHAREHVGKIETRLEDSRSLHEELEMLRMHDRGGYDSAVKVIHALAEGIKPAGSRSEVDATLNKIEEDRIAREQRKANSKKLSSAQETAKRASASSKGDPSK